MPAPKSVSTSGYSDDPLPPGSARWAAHARSDGYAPSAWKIDTPAEVTKIPSTCAQFVIDASDAILTHRVNATDLWYYHDADLVGRSLRAILTDLRPDWSRFLPAKLYAEETTVYLPELVPGAPGLSLAIHRLRYGEQMHVTIAPELAQSDTLKQAGIADFVPDAATFAKLFLRLRTVENRLDHYLSHLPGVVFHQRADLSFAYIGPGCENLLGLAPQSLSKDSQSLLRLIHPSDERSYYQELDRHADNATPFSLVYRLLNSQSGTCIYLLDVRSPVRSASGLLLGYEGVWLDITRQKIAEHRLTTRAWKESLSSLTGGLLNDFSNAMTGIYSLSEMYHNTLPAKHPLRDGLGLIKENAGQAQRLVKKILELNRETSGDKSYANLGKVVRDQMDLIKVILPRGTQLSGPQADGDWPVYLDETAFRQTLVSLAMNARDALRGSGDIRLLLRRLCAGDEPIVGTVPPLVPLNQPAVELVFADNGTGISAAHIARIFDPFFTTKESSRGAGLGLYNARLFAESHGGQIAARSTAGRGTEIVLLIPLADLSLAAPVPPPRGLPHRGPALAGPTRQVRVLYFEPGMTEEGPLVDALRHRDWDIRTVSTSEHARRVLREDGKKLDLVIVRQALADSELRILLAEVRRDHDGLPIVLSLTTQRSTDLSPSLRTQVDLVLSDDIREGDAAETLAKLLRLP